MALLTDGSPNDVTSLEAYETGILDVAATEKIDLGVKLGLATEEVSQDVLNILLDHASASDPQSNVRRNRGVSDVVVTPPMKRWHALHTLEIAYRDAFNNQLNDRYEAKVREYRELARQARDVALKFGIGLVTAPIPKAPPAVLATTAGPGQATTYYVAVTWVSATGQEGTRSDVTALTTGDSTVLVVGAANPPAVASGFNVYAGLSADALALQTLGAVPVGQRFTLTSGLARGAAPGDGQRPDVYIVGGSTLRRG
jgi:hypothetical protein